MQLLTYVQTSRITAWKHMVQKSDQSAMVYGSSDAVRFQHLKPGDVLWVIAATPGRPPSLTAKLVVESLGDEHCEQTRSNENARMLLDDPKKRFKWVAIGGKDSCFYGFNDAGKTLLDLPLLTGSGKPLNLSQKATQWESRFGYYLQRPVKIAEQPGENALEKLERHCQQNTIFISWKHSDHVRKTFPMSVAYALVEQGFAVWFDLLALPVSKYTPRIQKNPEVMTTLLKYGYKQCRCLLAIDSVHYGVRSQGSDKNWTLEEWNGTLDAKQRRIRFCIPLSADRRSGVTASADHVLRQELPSCIAKQVHGILAKKKNQ